jgi:hypothetical protein
MPLDVWSSQAHDKSSVDRCVVIVSLAVPGEMVAGSGMVYEVGKGRNSFAIVSRRAMPCRRQNLNLTHMKYSLQLTFLGLKSPKLHATSQRFVLDPVSTTPTAQFVIPCFFSSSMIAFALANLPSILLYH